MSEELATTRLSYCISKQEDKENIPLRVNYDNRKEKKFVYSYQHDKRSTSHKKSEGQGYLSKDEEIERLKQELKEQKEKVKHLETTIIEEQCGVLDHLELLQSKFQKVTSEKKHLEVELRKIKEKQEQSSYGEAQEWAQKYEKLENQFKKVKNISTSLVDMMKKVDGIDGGVHQAWKWTKKVIWEYEGIRKKALQWKTVYDQVTEALPLINNHQN